jgi:hypothetical protein
LPREFWDFCADEWLFLLVPLERVAGAAFSDVLF